MTRRDWWLGIGAIALVILLHAVFPRYEWRGEGTGLIRIDRWTGSAVVGTWEAGRWTYQPTITFRVEDIDRETK
jgi:hypothetical protein